MDVISIPKIKAHYRVLINNKGKIVIININEKEAAFKLCKIRNKSPLGKKIQINCTDGRNILIEKGDYKTSDSLVVEMPSQKIKENLPFAKGNTILLLGGKHMGDIGLLEEIKGNKIICKKGKEYVETLKKYAFVIGKDKSIITLP